LLHHIDFRLVMVGVLINKYDDVFYDWKVAVSSYALFYT
jgi:hypothetical protein